MNCIRECTYDIMTGASAVNYFGRHVLYRATERVRPLVLRKKTQSADRS